MQLIDHRARDAGARNGIETVAGNYCLLDDTALLPLPTAGVTFL